MIDRTSMNLQITSSESLHTKKYIIDRKTEEGARSNASARYLFGEYRDEKFKQTKHILIARKAWIKYADQKNIDVDTPLPVFLLTMTGK